VIHISFLKLKMFFNTLGQNLCVSQKHNHFFIFIKNPIFRTFDDEPIERKKLLDYIKLLNDLIAYGLRKWNQLCFLENIQNLDQLKVTFKTKSDDLPSIPTEQLSKDNK